MKLATFNVNGIRSRLANLLAWLEREQPDVACLQELKAPHEQFPVRELRAAGYESIWHGQMSWNGVAILSRGATPVELRRGLPGDQTDTHSRYLEAAAHGVIVGCLYLPNGAGSAASRTPATTRRPGSSSPMRSRRATARAARTARKPAARRRRTTPA